VDSDKTTICDDLDLVNNLSSVSVPWTLIVESSRFSVAKMIGWRQQEGTPVVVRIRDAILGFNVSAIASTCCPQSKGEEIDGYNIRDVPAVPPYLRVMALG
jgi:hypothetical protein